MKKKLIVVGLLLALASAVIFAESVAGKVVWTWGGDTIVATSIDQKDHTLELAITVSNRGYESCVNADIDVSARNGGTWNVKDKVGRNASIVSVSTNGCR
jgi:hypothetical protein